MKLVKNLRWLWVILILIVTTAMIQMTLDHVIYLPVVMLEATLTPTITFTPTPTKTPTSTPTPDYVVIMDISNSDTSDPLDEYVSIKNYDTKTINLTGWFIRDDGSNRYNFPANFYVASKQTIRLWTKAGTNTSTDLFWGSPVEVWNDERDCAYLRDDSDGDNELIDIYCYEEKADGTILIIHNPTE